jgi:hypothetical protein
LAAPGRLEAACSGSGTTWHCTAGSSVSNVQTAINNAGDGAVITFDPGLYSWTSDTIQLSNTKSVTLQGAGQGSSVVTVASNTFIGMNGALNGNNTKNYRITGFTFQNGSGLGIWFWGPGTLNNLRIDHNTFSNFSPSAVAIFFGESSTRGAFFGVIDHNTFTGPVNFMSLKVLGMGDPSYWSSSVRGTSSNIFVEDNIYNFATNTSSSLEAGCIDAWHSSAVVFRYNTVLNCLVTAHGVGHGGGTVNFELYGNTIEANSGSTVPTGYRMVHHQGSGEITIWGNAFVHTGTINGSAIEVTHYRSASTSAAEYTDPPGPCDGTKSRDGNTAPAGRYFGFRLPTARFLRCMRG